MSRQFLTPLALPAGTTSNPPLLLQSGSNLTTAAAGAVEYDGKVIYSTPDGRGVSPSMMFYRLNSSYVGSNTGTAQSVFGVGVSLQASTVYAFDIMYLMVKTSGTTAHDFRISFEGTATINNIQYQALKTYTTTSATSNFIANPYHVYAQSAASFSTGTMVSSSYHLVQLMMKGTVSINAAGTFIPRYTLVTAPGGAYSTMPGSYFAIWPIGAAGANTSVGAWA